MIFSFFANDLNEDSRPSGDILGALVDSLYAPILSLAVGSSSAAFFAFIVAWRTNEIALANCAILLTLVSAMRLALVAAYRRRDPETKDDPSALAKWELGYAVGAYAFAGSLGAFDYVALTRTDDAVVHMLVLTVTTGCMAGAVIRNSSVRHIALWQLMLNVIPVCAAAIIRGDPAYYILAAVFLLYAVSGVEICLYQSANTLRVLRARKEKAELAGALAEQNRRFDDALNNMPQGLCMFDAEGRLVVANARVSQICGAPQMVFGRGRTIEELLWQLEAAGAISAQDADRVGRELRENLIAGRAACTLIPLPGGRIVSATQAPQAGGGAIILYDDVTERQEAEARVRYLATHDMLTGLPNRTLFTQMLRDEVESARRAHRRFAVLFIDLDRFKAINDTLGHAAGDSLLREISIRLTQCPDAGGLSARIGGDEFVAVARSVEEPQDALRLAERMLAHLAAPMTIAGQECGVTASIGVAFYPADGEDEETLLRNADAAMYLAKAEGKSGVRLYSPKVKTQTLQGLRLEADIRHAIERDELLVVYQPKRCVSSGAVTGVEALLRWRHPDLGELPPGRFIPIAEETGAIVPIGRWVLETACAQHMAWRARGAGPLSVAVNLSPRQLYDAHILLDIAAALAKSGMAPNWLELEITESMVMQDTADAIRVLQEIKRAGVKIALDDFGTGYSSLSLVKRLPLDALKIDRSFVSDVLTDPNDRAIVEAVISLGKALKLRVVAEGVETEAQDAFLRARGCDEIQGFLFSRPLEAEALFQFVTHHDRWPRLMSAKRA